MELVYSLLVLAALGDVADLLQQQDLQCTCCQLFELHGAADALTGILGEQGLWVWTTHHRTDNQGQARALES